MQQTIDKIPQDLMDKPDQITANEYLPGQGIAAHIDTHSAFTKAIASLSLENEILMEFRHPDGRCERLMVPTRSLLVMTGASRYEWTHAIPPRAFDVIDGQKVNRKRRVSITFRKLSNTNVCTCDYPVQCDFQQKQNISTTKTSLAPTKMEQQYVHEFYETVAKHFSSTRYAPWPRVAEFVRSLPFGSLVADIGCGNGKYMKCVAPNTSAIVGGDRSESLAKICQEAGLNILVCDALTVPYRSESCDAALSIAVLHHLSTLHHRLQAVKEIIRVLRVGGRGIIYAWALEQTKGSKRRFDQDKQDFYVPWNLDRRFVKKKEKDQEEKIHEETQEAAREATGKKNDKIVVQRFCHMFKQGELEEIVQLAGNAVVEEHYYDESNWAIILRRTS
jgi:alkylated DNA repair protein alkB family protein 8